MNNLRISEVFTSIQGEARRQGDRCTFVRLHGCDMRCTWCDTMYAVEGDDYDEKSLEEVVEEVKDRDPRYVCVTGGEPLFAEGGRELVRRLLDEGFNVDVETNGAHPFADLKEKGARIVMDVKTPSSGEESDLSLLDDLGPRDDVKFVVEDERDYRYAKLVLEEQPTEAEAFFQPVGGRDVEFLEEMVDREGLDATIQRQLHKMKGVR